MLTYFRGFFVNYFVQNNRHKRMRCASVEGTVKAFVDQVSTKIYSLNILYNIFSVLLSFEDEEVFFTD